MFKLLQTFRVVYETRNFSQSAEILFLSQPSVSHQIKQLETELQVVLFQRNGRQEMVATKQADILYQRTLNLLDDWQQTVDALVQESNQKVSCRIVASHTFAVYCLPELMTELLQKFPKVSFEIVMANSHDALDKVAKHEADIGFIEKPLATEGILRRAILSDQLVLAGNVASSPWLIREKTSGVYHYMKRYFDEENITEPILEVQSNEVIVALLKQGIGRSIISKRAVPTEIAFEPLSKSYQRHFYFIERNHLTSPVMSQVIQALLAFYEGRE
ncbi:hypothetical protein IGI37_003118 [Enterococcus sp. AZ194]|uniref:LysR substrate-binding domain-containing protein n=1 Tax=Enterococcus sp. AZ194 TaxID=2774629 RepID=UPI003F297FB9